VNNGDLRLFKPETSENPDPPVISRKYSTHPHPTDDHHPHSNTLFMAFLMMEFDRAGMI
jgi:hypothetical protein